MRDKDREAKQDYWDIHLEEEKEHIEKAKAKGEPMLILNEKVVWVNKDYSKFKNVKILKKINDNNKGIIN